MLDTIGSMTENAILRSVKYNDDDDNGGEGMGRQWSNINNNELMGGGIDNKPPVKLPPTDANLSRYSAVFPSYQMDNGNVLQPNPTFGNAIFSGDYPPYPDAVKLRINPNLPPYDKDYSTDDNSSTDDSLSFNSSSSDDNNGGDDEKNITIVTAKVTFKVV